MIFPQIYDKRTGSMGAREGGSAGNGLKNQLIRGINKILGELVLEVREFVNQCLVM